MKVMKTMRKIERFKLNLTFHEEAKGLNISLAHTGCVGPFVIAANDEVMQWL